MAIFGRGHTGGGSGKLHRAELLSISPKPMALAATASVRCCGKTAYCGSAPSAVAWYALTEKAFTVLLAVTACPATMLRISFRTERDICGSAPRVALHGWQKRTW